MELINPFHARLSWLRSLLHPKSTRKMCRYFRVECLMLAFHEVPEKFSFTDFSTLSHCSWVDNGRHAKIARVTPTLSTKRLKYLTEFKSKYVFLQDQIVSVYEQKY